MCAHAYMHTYTQTAVLWANIVMAASWDGVVRCYVYSE